MGPVVFVKAPVGPPWPVHPHARCCWCGERFQQVGPQRLWVCPTRACAIRQQNWALKQGEKYIFLPTPRQVEFFEMQREKRRTLYGGAAGGAKSHSLRWAAYRYCLLIPDCEVLLLRRTYRDLELTHLREMRREAVKIGAKYEQTARKMSFPSTGASIVAGHCEDAEAWEHYLSTEYDLILIDELVTFEEEPALEIFTRARSANVKSAVLEHLGGAKVWAASNPGGSGAAWVRDFFIDKTPEPERYPNYRADSYGFVPAKVDDNPWGDPEYRENLQELPPLRRRQLLDGDWTVYKGQFFSGFRAQVGSEPWHVRDIDVPDGTEWTGGLDWGYNQPGSFGLYAHLGDGHYHRAAELKFQGLNSHEFGSKARDLINEVCKTGRLRYIAADPSMWNKTGADRGEPIAETLSKSPYRLPLRKGDNTRGSNGWQICHDLLRTAPDGRPWFSLSPRCRYFLRSVPLLPQDPNDPDDVDTNADDHAADEWRYWAKSRPSPTRKLIKPDVQYVHRQEKWGEVLDRVRMDAAR